MTESPTRAPVRVPPGRLQGAGPRAVTAALLATLLAALLASAAQAAPSFVPDALTSVTGSVVDFMNLSASQAASPACYAKGDDPDHTFNCTLQVLRQTGLDAQLPALSPFTLFAPTDTAFRNLASLMGASAFRRLMVDRERLTTLMRHHLVVGAVTTRSLAARASGATGIARLPTVDGGTLVVDFDRFPPAGRAVAKVGTARTRAWQAYIVDHAVQARDGVVIPIDMVVLPPGF